MTSQLLVILLIDGLILSGVYALAALGFVIIYRATGVFNFAQGELMMLGAYLFYAFTAQFELSLGLSAFLTLLSLAMLGGALYWLIMRPMTTQPLFAAIIITMGIAILLRAAGGLIWGASSLYPRPLWRGEMVSIGSFSISVFDLVSISVVAVTYAAVLAFLRYSPIGLEMRASAESPTLASQRGINLNKVFIVSWVIASVSAAAAGAVASSRSAVGPEIAHLGINAFPAALVGGLDSVIGTLVGALVVGFVHTFAAWQFGSDTHDIVSAFILLVVLLVRPNGLFGTPRIMRL